MSKYVEQDKVQSWGVWLTGMYCMTLYIYDLVTHSINMQVLPFDDTLCVREPCRNFQDCLSVLKFGNASGFISSEKFLFRPIYPVHTFACLCSDGFTGESCLPGQIFHSVHTYSIIHFYISFVICFPCYISVVSTMLKYLQSAMI